MLEPFARRLRRFARHEDGAVTVEAVLWIPFFFAVLVLIADVSYVFYGRAEAFRVIEDGNRALSVGFFDSPEDTEAYIEEVYSAYSPRVAVNSEVITTASNMRVVNTRMDIPASDLMMFNWLENFSDFTIHVQSAQYIE